MGLLVVCLFGKVGGGVGFADGEDSVIITAAYLQVGTMSSSKSPDQRDHIISTAVMGCTSCAHQISDAEASDNPKCFTFPSSTNFFISPTYMHVHTHEKP
jgi:hypothetical protein